MPAPQVHLDLADAAELGEMLTFISQWPGGTDHAQPGASFGRFIGTQGYDLAELRTDLWTPTGFVDTIRSGTMVYEERTGSGTGSQEVHPGI